MYGIDSTFGLDEHDISLIFGEDDIDEDDMDDGEIIVEQLLRSGHLPTVRASIKEHRYGDKYIILYQNPHDDIVMSRKQFMGLMGMFLNSEVEL